MTTGDLPWVSRERKARLRQSTSSRMSAWTWRWWQIKKPAKVKSRPALRDRILDDHFLTSEHSLRGGGEGFVQGSFATRACSRPMGTSKRGVLTCMRFRSWMFGLDFEDAPVFAIFPVVPKNFIGVALATITAFDFMVCRLRASRFGVTVA